MAVFKGLLEGDRARAALTTLAAGYIRLIESTTRWTFEGRSGVEPLIASGAPVILCFWHSRLLMARTRLPWRRRIHVLVSLHRDGRMIGETAERLGCRTIAGSSRRGGAQALRAMVRVLAAGDSVAIAPDGPRGPRMRAAPGATVLARMSGATIVPIGCSTRWGIRFGSWDRFFLPLPFGRGVFRFGEPLTVPRDADAAALEEHRRELERRLTAATTLADRACGRDTPEPAPEPARPGEAEPAEHAA